VVHGSISARELAPFGLTPDRVLDFSVNTNPLGPAPSVLDAVRGTDWSRYPGDDEPPLRAALAAEAGVDRAQVALGNGSAELLWLIALASLRPGDDVAIVGPTFGEYARAAQAVGATVREVDALAAAGGARLVFVCNPNNPTSTYAPRAEIVAALQAVPQRILVLDEAYLAFVDAPWASVALLAESPNLVVVRSLTKDHAVPGLRLGYLLAAPDVARAVDAVRPPWSVNAGALRAGLAALEPPARAHLARARTLVADSRARLAAGFAALGYPVHPARANFILVDVGDGATFRRALLPAGLIVRDCASFGLPRHVRVSCRLPAECDRLLTAVRDLPR
jgi:histidinol-phosphate aminotransferase